MQISGGHEKCLQPLALQRVALHYAQHATKMGIGICGYPRSKSESLKHYYVYFVG
jgi:hypothetical protein